jgi:thiol-disulfide isomerase/thioredoxin
MKKLFLILLISIGIASCEAQTSFSKQSLSEKLTDSNGKKISFKNILKKHKGKPVVIEIWASWCSDCVKAMPSVKEMQANNTNVEYIFISMDKTFDKWKAGIEKHELTTGNHYWVDDALGMKGAFGKSINLDWIPRYIIIDKTGKIVVYRAIETEFEKINNTLKSLE